MRTRRRSLSVIVKIEGDPLHTQNVQHRPKPKREGGREGGREEEEEEEEKEEELIQKQTCKR